MNMDRKAVGFKNNINNNGLTFQNNIRAGLMLVIGFVDSRQIPCSCSDCLRKMAPPCNIIQDNYNQVW